MFFSFIDQDPVAIPAAVVNQKILIENIGRRDTGDEKLCTNFEPNAYYT